MNIRRVRRIHLMLLGICFTGAVLCLSQEGTAWADGDNHKNIYMAPSSSSAPQTLIAVGYGRAVSKQGYSASQKKLMALRAAKLDAYRNLLRALRDLAPHSAEQYAAAGTDGFIQGAYFIQERVLGHDQYEVELGVPITTFQPQAFQNIQPYGKPLIAERHHISHEEWQDWAK